MAKGYNIQQPSEMDMTKSTKKNPNTRSNEPAGDKRTAPVNPNMNLSRESGLNHSIMMSESQHPGQPMSPIPSPTGKQESSRIQAGEGSKKSAGNPQMPTATGGSKRTEGVNPDMDLQKA